MTFAYSPADPCSFANTVDVRTVHVHLALAVSFVERKLAGSVVLTVHVRKGCNEIILDTASLNVINVSIRPVAFFNVENVQWRLGNIHAKFGQSLLITLPQPLKDENSELHITVQYETTPAGKAIGWMTPAQTVGKLHPYLFTQCQAIHARSLLPCQDTPQLKLTYSAEITVSEPLVALMSAQRIANQTERKGTTIKYVFEQAIPIPSYLIALAVGNIKGIDIGPRTTVFSEPEVVDMAAKEYEDTETIIQTAEKLLNMKYEWGRYDLLVMPGSFPYGGMENPNLTFITPTLLAGDKSLVDVIMHEFAHSYSGNLVTNKNWQSFWLNEGWTMFLERKIMGRMHGEQTRQLSAIIGLKALEESVVLFGPTNQLTALTPNLTDMDPDDAFSSVPYGGPTMFEPYMTAYFKQFARKALDTSEWKEHLYDYIRKNHSDKVQLLDSVDWNKWLLAPGMPPVTNKFDRTLVNACEDLVKRWATAKTDTSTLSSFRDTDLTSFTPVQKIVFLGQIDDIKPLSIPLITKMDELYQLSSVQNSEIRFLWQQICLAANYEAIFPNVAEFLSEMGRMKFVRPLFRSLNTAQNGRPFALQTFERLRNTYHPICAQLVAKDLGL